MRKLGKYDWLITALALMVFCWMALLIAALLKYVLS